jgi:hypothetical protein
MRATLAATLSTVTTMRMSRQTHLQSLILLLISLNFNNFVAISELAPAKTLSPWVVFATHLLLNLITQKLYSVLPSQRCRNGEEMKEKVVILRELQRTIIYTNELNKQAMECHVSRAFIVYSVNKGVRLTNVIPKWRCRLCSTASARG